jgi:hypothetical protein
LADLFPKETLERLGSIASSLQSRRKFSWVSLAGAVASVVWLVLNANISWEKAGEIPKLFKAHPWAIAAITVFGIGFVLARYFGFLRKESQEPIRYTVFIDDFKAIASDTECEIHSGSKQIDLLPNDLMERIHTRLGRFSLLPPEVQAQATEAGGESHFQVKAEYAVRKDKQGEVLLHVWPRVRFGKPSDPFAVAAPVRLPLPDLGTLGPELYERLVERVYSSITTEIYKQIEVDLRDKMAMFPSAALRALARYVEGRDFENSNTIDAYDRAIELYRDTLSDLKSSWKQKALLFFARQARFLAGYRWTGVKRAMRAQARTNLGLARCLISRRLVSGMSGRGNLAIFEVRRLLFGALGDGHSSAWDLFTGCYNATVPKEYQVPPELAKAVRQPCPSTDTAEKFDTLLREFCRALSSESRPGQARIFRSISEDEDLCETAAISALAQNTLSDRRSAERFSRFAEAMEMRSDSKQTEGLILLVKAELEPDLTAKIRLLQQAAKQSRLSEVVLFRLARASDLLARDEGMVTPDHVPFLARAYEEVLKVNPGNIASLISQGYLYWLVEKWEQARASLTAGIEMETIVARTYVGDLKYCLARVEAEHPAGDAPAVELQKASELFREAILADPSVSAMTASKGAPVQNVYFDRVNDQIVKRFRLFYERISRLEGEPGELAVVRSAALNDYASACFAYYLRFGVGTAREKELLTALTLYREAGKLRGNDPVLKYNFLTACGWTWGMQSSAPAWTQGEWKTTSNSLVETGECLAPDELAYVLSIYRQNVQEQSAELDKQIEQAGKRETGNQSPPGGSVSLAAGQQPVVEVRGSVASPPPSQSAKGPGTSDFNLAQKEPEKSRGRNPTEPAAGQSPSSVTGTPINTVAGAGDGREAGKRESDSLEKQREDLRTDSDKYQTRLVERIREGPRLQFLKDAEDDWNLLDWYAFEEPDVGALAAYAGHLCEKDPTCEGEGKQGLSLGSRILALFYPDYFEVLRAIATTKRKGDAEDRMRAMLDRVQLEDPKNVRFKAGRLDMASEDELKEFIKKPAYRELPKLHDMLADKGEQALQARMEACRLAPLNDDYRRKLREALRPAVQMLRDAEWTKREDRSVFECLLNPESASCVAYEGAIHPDLEDKIQALRTAIRMELGITLPGVRFRDSGLLKNTEVRAVIREQAVRSYTLSSGPQDEAGRREEIAKYVGQTARAYAARIYGPAECADSLKNMEATAGFEIRNEPEALAAFTLVLKRLLSERVSIACFSDLAIAFAECRTEGLGVAQTTERLRSVAAVRDKLPGTTPAGNTVELPGELAAELNSFAARANPDTPPEDWNELRNKIRGFAVNRIKRTGTGAALVTDAVARPFVSKACMGLAIPVLSKDEIGPEGSLSGTNDGKPAGKATAQAAD